MLPAGLLQFIWTHKITRSKLFKMNAYGKLDEQFSKGWKKCHIHQVKIINLQQHMQSKLQSHQQGKVQALTFTASVF